MSVQFSYIINSCFSVSLDESISEKTYSIHFTARLKVGTCLLSLWDNTNSHIYFTLLSVLSAAHSLLKNVSDDASVQSAAASLSQKLGSSSKLYAIVNNAGTGFSHNSSPAEILDTNTRGPRRVVDAFLPYLDSKIGRIVNLGSGAAPMFVAGSRLANERKKRYLNPMDMKEIEDEIAYIMKMNDEYAAYGGSKALLACYTMKLAQLHPNLSISILSPGYILTDMTRGMGATKPPAEGTVSLIKCLFEDLNGKSGYFWGSDGLRSPLHYLRNPGEPEYDGAVPTFN